MSLSLFSVTVANVMLHYDQLVLCLLQKTHTLSISCYIYIYEFVLMYLMYISCQVYFNIQNT